MARPSERARLLVIGTYRPVEVLSREHPLRAIKQELQTHGYCAELSLDFLSEEEVAEYLAQRFAVGAMQESLLRLARPIHQRTDGNPLFMANMLNDLIARGVLGQSDGQWTLQGNIEEHLGKVPESLQQLIEQRVARLRPETQRLLEVGSVAGAEFSAAAMAAGVEAEIEVIEAHCEELVRQEHFLRASGTSEWPDGTVAARYGFLHALYQDVLYHRLTARQRQRLHQRIGERQEQDYGERATEIAAELALHFERGRDYWRAIHYLQKAGVNTVRRSAHREAMNLLTRGLELLPSLPDTPERAQQELRLQLTLGPALIVIKGYGAPEVGNTYARARELCQQVGEPPQFFQVLNGLYPFHFVRAEFQAARELGEQLFTLAQSGKDLTLLVVAHMALGTTLSLLGELVPAREHLERSLALYDSQKHCLPAVFYAYADDIGVACLSYAAWVLWLLGYPNHALKRSNEAVALAQELVHPHSLTYTLSSAVRLHQLRRERQAGQERAEALMALLGEHGFLFWLAMGTIARGWALVIQGQRAEGIAQMRQGLAAHRATGAEVWRPYHLALLAEAYGKVGQIEDGVSTLDEAVEAVDKTGERFYEAELYRLYGELSLRIGEPVTTKEESENRRWGESVTSGRESVSSSPVPRFSGSPVLRFPGSPVLRFCLRLPVSPFLPQKTPSSRPSRLRGGNKPSRWSCGRR